MSVVGATGRTFPPDSRSSFDPRGGVLSDRDPRTNPGSWTVRLLAGVYPPREAPGLSSRVRSLVGSRPVGRVGVAGCATEAPAQTSSRVGPGGVPGPTRRGGPPSRVTATVTTTTTTTRPPVAAGAGLSAPGRTGVSRVGTEPCPVST